MLHFCLSGIALSVDQWKKLKEQGDELDAVGQEM
jgi:hypothetical protein